MERPAFYPLDEFPRLMEFARHWPLIQQEAMQLDAPLMAVDRVGRTHEQVVQAVMEAVNQGHPYGWVAGWGPQGINTQWRQYGLRYGQLYPFDVESRMPSTVALLRQLPGVKVCSLSRLTGPAVLPVHTHDELPKENLLQFHLALGNPSEDCAAYLQVGGVFWKQSAGAAAVFDGSLPHFAVNASLLPRTILYMEFNVSALRDLSVINRTRTTPAP